MSCMWYAIEGHDGNDVLARRRQARPEHLARLTALRDAGRLLLAGPCPAIDAVDPGPAGFSGSIVVARFESLEEAKTWADADPYVAAGVSVRTDVRPFTPVPPCPVPDLFPASTPPPRPTQPPRPPSPPPAPK